MNSSPLILAIETSTGFCSVGLYQGDAILAQANEKAPGQQSRRLISMLEEVLLQAKCDYEDCDAIACALGPGGFTSLRVGLASARAIALATHKPFIGVGTLEVMAFCSGLQGEVVAAVDAYRSQWYAQRFQVHGSIQLMGNPLLVNNDALEAFAQGAKITYTLPNAVDVARYASLRWMSGERQFSSNPLYIRAPDAKIPSKVSI